MILNGKKPVQSQPNLSGAANTNLAQVLPEKQDKWYQNPAFMSFLVSVIALGFSLEAKIRARFGTLEIRIKTPDQFVIFHVFGNLYVNIALDISNVGDKTVSLSKIVCLIINRNDKNRKLTIPVRTYYSNIGMGTDLPEYGFPLEPSLPTFPSVKGSQSAPDFLFGTINLRPGESWTKAVTCNKLLSRKEEKRLNELRSVGRESIRNKYEESMDRRQNANNNKRSILNNLIGYGSAPATILPNANRYFVEMDENAYDDIKRFCTDMLKRDIELVEGAYQMYIAAHSEKGEAICAWEVEFQLYEQNIQALLDFKNYKKGQFGMQERIYLRAHATDNKNPEASLKKYNDLIAP